MTHISTHMECRDDINEQRILTAPAIMLSDHRAVYDAKCGRRQRGEGFGQIRTPADRGRGYENGSFFADVLYGRPLSSTHVFTSSPLRNGHNGGIIVKGY